MKKLKIIFFLILTTYLTNSFSQVQIGSSIVGDSIRQYLGNSVSMPDDRTLAIASPSLSVWKGFVQIYQLKRTGWVQKGNNIYGSPLSQHFGTSIFMPDTNTIAIGAAVSGIVQVYKWSGAAWVQKGITINSAGFHTRIGRSIHMPDSNTIAIGAPSPDNLLPGNTRIYKWNSVSWEQKGNDILGVYPELQSGTSVSMPDPNTIGIGATGAYGSARIYTWNGTDWTPKGLKITGEALGDKFGSAISMPDTNTIAIGGPYNDGNGSNAGHARVYVWNGLSWAPKGIDIDGKGINHQFGSSVVMPDPNTLAVAAVNIYNTIPGTVRLYKWNGNAWIQNSKTIYGNGYYDSFGYSISMPDVNNIAIGNPYDTTVSVGSGKVMAYSFCNTLDTVSIRTCNRFTSPSGLTWSNSGSYLDTIPNSKGCDSMIRFNVTLRKINDGILNFGTSLAASSFSGTYQWMDCNNNLTAIPGATNQQFTPTAPGYYAVQVTDLGCTVMSNCEYVNTVGLNENYLDNIKISPNPTNGVINIDFGTNNLNVDIKVSSISGKLVEQLLNVNSNRTRIDLSDNPVGVYVITVQNKDFVRILKVVRN